ncbi:MAG: DUF302 domain-containing protein [Bacteroidales bacterium]|nr:DUF302 domain-containing protein [Bacteroidales bacterium]MCF8398441.1 DUF302 domain-containing protein [Bacteroidales bacterium]
MKYYINREIKSGFEEAIEKVTEELKKEGFGVLSDIDVSATLKKKLDVDFPRYRILGACNPGFAHKALQEEEKIGTMLPCNVIVREIPNDYVEVAAIDPVASMQAVENEKIKPIAEEVKKRLTKVITQLG